MSGMGGAQQDRCAHRLTEGEQGRRTVGQDDFIDEALEIDLVLREIAHVALERVAQRSIRQSLSAPVEDRDREAAGAQIAYGLEILLDEFRAPRKQTDGALASWRRRPARETQRHPIGRLEGSGVAG